MKGKIINFIILGITIALIIWLGIEEYKEVQIETKKIILEPSSKTQKIQKEIDNDNKEKQYPKEMILEEYKGYNVAAKLQIPDIDLETYILKTYSTNSLNISVTKFWGADPNQIGNFCVAGHNYKNKNMFHNLKKLKIGNSLFITENNVGKIEYEIYDKYKVIPKQVSCLSQHTNGKREVTLITCTNDSKERIIIKAKEKE